MFHQLGRTFLLILLLSSEAFSGNKQSIAIGVGAAVGILTGGLGFIAGAPAIAATLAGVVYGVGATVQNATHPEQGVNFNVTVGTTFGGPNNTPHVSLDVRNEGRNEGLHIEAIPAQPPPAIPAIPPPPIQIEEPPPKIQTVLPIKEVSSPKEESPCQASESARDDVTNIISLPQVLNEAQQQQQQPITIPPIIESITQSRSPVIIEPAIISPQQQPEHESPPLPPIQPPLLRPINLSLQPPSTSSLLSLNHTGGQSLNTMNPEPFRNSSPIFTEANNQASYHLNNYASYHSNQPDDHMTDTVDKIISIEKMNRMNWKNINIDDLKKTLIMFEITTPKKIRLFLAQCEAETGKSDNHLIESKANAHQYEFRKSLGNTNEGDGVLFRGGGRIQLTGRYNYTKFAEYINDEEVLTRGSEYVAENYPWMSAGFWWHQNKMNELIDNGATCDDVSRRVNGPNISDDNVIRRREIYEKLEIEIPDDILE